MDRLVVRPGPPLEGSVRVSGAKNSVLKLLAATLLAEGEHVVRNVPRIADVETMSDLLSSMGLVVQRRRPDELVVRRPARIVPEAPYDLVERMRASIVVLGPLLASQGQARVAMPGGDDLGSRPIDLHLQGLQQLGATFDFAHGTIEARADHLVGTSLLLEFPSVGATENILMAAVKAKGTTVVENAAREPEIADLAAFLNRMGARIVGAGTPTIEIEGVDELSPVEHEVIPDRVEAATFLAAVGIAGGEVTLEGARPDHMDMLMQKLGEMGLRTSPTGEGIWASSRGRLRSVDVSTLPYPGIATDYKPLLVSLL
ncbi:MAG: UDP-N-acetylglucosamine 1-carboxyvinyltransferase, partial [Actinomycetota bacterium]|nr:UDP-N-acetylglucosamine 1-carboxyvinyltransferase [Actinomycetota bacterium]